MITVTRRNGTTFALNPDLIERVEATPDTVVTLVSGTKYVVAETVEEIVAEMLVTTTSERQGRAIDRDAGASSMEKKKQEGYF